MKLYSRIKAQVREQKVEHKGDVISEGKQTKATKKRRNLLLYASITDNSIQDKNPSVMMEDPLPANFEPLLFLQNSKPSGNSQALFNRNIYVLNSLSAKTLNSLLGVSYVIYLHHLGTKPNILPSCPPPSHIVILKR